MTRITPFWDDPSIVLPVDTRTDEERERDEDRMRADAVLAQVVADLVELLPGVLCGVLQDYVDYRASADADITSEAFGLYLASEVEKVDRLGRDQQEWALEVDEMAFRLATNIAMDFFAREEEFMNLPAPEREACMDLIWDRYQAVC